MSNGGSNTRDITYADFTNPDLFERIEEDTEVEPGPNGIHRPTGAHVPVFREKKKPNEKETGAEYHVDIKGKRYRLRDNKAPWLPLREK